MSNDMPERIWVDPIGERTLDWAIERNERDDFTEEYIRKDIHEQTRFQCWMHFIFLDIACGTVRDLIAMRTEQEDELDSVKSELTASRDEVKRLRELLSDAVEDETEFETEWNKMVRKALEQSHD